MTDSIRFESREKKRWASVAKFITAIRDVLNAGGLTAGGYTASFTAKLFDVTQVPRILPRFAIVTEPESIDVNLAGVAGDRALRLIVQGFLLSRRSQVTRMESESLLIGEDFVDLIVQELLKVETRDRFQGSFGEESCGFSITAIGPTIVEEYALAADLVYMSVPLLTEFLEN